MGGKVKRDRVILEGKVIDNCKGIFLVDIGNNTIVSCRISGKIRQNAIKIVNGDEVRIEVSELDTNQGRIIVRK